MIGKIIQCVIIALVGLAAFLALEIAKPFSLSAPVKAPELKPTFTLNAEPGKPIIFGIIGDGTVAKDEKNFASINPLQLLLGGLNKNGAQAVFLNGNLVADDREGEDKKGEAISSQTLEQKLEIAVKGFREAIPEGIAFYPTIGDRELAIPGSPEVFKKVFRLEGAKVVRDGLAYTVAIGPVLIVVVPTDNVSGPKGSGEAFSSSTVEWLKQTLDLAPASFRYRFVVGFEPAYPSSTTFTSKTLSNRDDFWKVLVSNNVLAYFSSKEHVFDRSNRNGVWQVISGGGEASEGSRKSIYPFIHALLISVPNSSSENGGVPTLKIVDESGEVVDTFELKPQSEPLYQMRIS